MWFRAIFSFVVLVLALGAYLILQRTFVILQFDIFILASPKEVHDFVKDPKNLPDIHHRTKATVVDRFMIGPDGTEHRQFTVDEDFRHVGLHSFPARSSANPTTLNIYTSTDALYSLIQTHSVMKFKLHKAYDRVGTLVSYKNEIYTPQALRRFVNNTMWVTQRGMLENLKFILERTYKLDKDTITNDTLRVQEEELQEKEEEVEDVPDENEELAEGEEDDEWDLFHQS